MHSRDSPGNEVLKELRSFLGHIREEEAELWEELKLCAPSERARWILRLLFEDRLGIDVVGRHIAEELSSEDEYPATARDGRWVQLMILDVLRFFRAIAELLKNRE